MTMFRDILNLEFVPNTPNKDSIMKLNGLIYGYKKTDPSISFAQCIAISTDGSEGDHAEVVELVLELYGVQSELGDFNFYVWMPKFPCMTLGEMMPQVVHLDGGAVMLDPMADTMVG